MSSIQVPYDVALTIVSLLEAKDVCSLGTSCHYWHDICSSDCIWFNLFNHRWPHADVASPSIATCPNNQHAYPKVWKGLYINNHKKLASEISKFIEIVRQWAPHESLEVGIYLKALKNLESFKLEFEDVCLFLFKRNLSVLIHLIGLHYSIVYLHVPPSEVKRALINFQVSNREICLNWSKIGRWSYGFRLRDENCTRKLTLAELTTVKEQPLLTMLNRGAVYEVIRVQITSVKS